MEQSPRQRTDIQPRPSYDDGNAAGGKDAVDRRSGVPASLIADAASMTNLRPVPMACDYCRRTATTMDSSAIRGHSVLEMPAGWLLIVHELSGDIVARVCSADCAEKWQAK